MVTYVAGGLSKEEVIETNERLRAVRVRLEESYDTAKRSLITLMTKYTDSKSVRNVFHRYNLLRAMIKVLYKLQFDVRRHCTRTECVKTHINQMNNFASGYVVSKV
jgi:hypothetical protein